MHNKGLDRLINTQQLLTPQEAAHHLGVTPHTLGVWRCTKRYSLRYVKVGRCVRYRPEDIECFIKQNTQLITY